MKNKLIFFLLLLSMILLLSACGGSGIVDNPFDDGSTDSGSISGIVYLQNEGDHSGISILLEEENLVVNSDAEGLYSFNDLSDGSYTLTYSKDGYSTVQKEAVVADGNNIEVSPFTLMIAVEASNNPVAGSLQGHGQYFDFETGQMTTDWSIGDMRLNASSIMTGTHLMHIDEVKGQIFEETYEGGSLSFAQFRNISEGDLDLPTEMTLLHSPYLGDVIVLKTDQDKLVKLIITEIINDDSDEDAPKYSFQYLYDQINDTTIPVLQEVILVTADGNETSQTVDGGAITFNVTSQPVELKYILNEYVKATVHPYYLNGSLSLVISSANWSLPYYNVYQTSLGAISGTGQYLIELHDDDTYYFEDMSANRMSEKPFSSITINYQ